MFRALFAQLQEVLHKQQLVYCVRVMSVVCTRIGLKFKHFLNYTYCIDIIGNLLNSES
jgi:hypothetical protein